jgi:hypothetical protein
VTVKNALAAILQITNKVAKYGPVEWPSLASHMPGRRGQQLRDRYTRSLKESGKKRKRISSDSLSDLEEQDCKPGEGVDQLQHTIPQQHLQSGQFRINVFSGDPDMKKEVTECTHAQVHRSQTPEGQLSEQKAPPSLLSLELEFDHRLKKIQPMTHHGDFNNNGVSTGLQSQAPLMILPTNILM